MRVLDILQKCSSILMIKVIESKPDDNGKTIIRCEASVNKIITNEVVLEKVRMISCQENLLKLYI